MNNLVINPDQQTGSFNRKIVAVVSDDCTCGGCVKRSAENWLDMCKANCTPHSRNDGKYIIWKYADDIAAPADPSDTAMLDYLLAHCTCITEWKSGRDAVESREENKSLRTREDVRKAMEGL
jgi:hypothetical protein